VVLSSSDGRLAPAQAAGRTPRVIWHDIECGAYRADLPLWRELADGEVPQPGSGPILEVGAGTGRVALDLLHAGHRVTALDLDAELLFALRGRAGEMEVETVCADARTFDLGRESFVLCIVPMQTVQLLGGSSERIAFMRRARTHLRPGGVLACAIVTELEPFDCAAGDHGPSAETARFEGNLYVSRAVRVRVRTGSIVIERERRVFAGGPLAEPPASERDVIELARVSPAQLEREAVEAGLTPAPTRSIAATEDHVGSAVVMLRA
jgi:SAM-dependent methyltransferase